MKHICKKCGCDILIKSGDWYECPVCGTVMFNTDVLINNLESPTKALEAMERGESIDSFTLNFNKNSTVSPSVDERGRETFDFSVNEKEAEKHNVEPSEPDTAEKEREAEKEKKEKKHKERRILKSKPKKADAPNVAERKGSESDGNKTEAEKDKNAKIKEGVQFCTPIVIALVIAILLKLFVFANAVVPTGSMINTIQEGDRIIASRLAYINNDPERYDIIIFKYPDDESQLYVKRIIGMPGETVTILDGSVYVTGSDGETQKLRDDFVTNGTPEGDFGPYTVPEGSYFVMGDNRNESWDSRYWDNKFVKKSKILGKVKFRYYPNPGKIE